MFAMVLSSRTPSTKPSRLPQLSLYPHQADMLERRWQRLRRPHIWRWTLSAYYGILVVSLTVCVIVGGSVVLAIVAELMSFRAGIMSRLWSLAGVLLGSVVGAISSMAMMLITRHVTESIDQAYRLQCEQFAARQDAAKSAGSGHAPAPEL